MAMAVKDKEQQLNIRDMVLAGFEQSKVGNVKDFNAVCDRLEKNIRMQRYAIKMSDLAETDLESAGDYIKGVVYVIRILHMLIDSRTWLYKTLNIAI